MYSSRGSHEYGHASFAGQSAYAQTLGPGYPGSSAGVPEGSSQVSLSSRHSSMLGTSQEAEVGGYRGHTAGAPHYGGQYSSVYGSAALSGAQEVPAINVSVTGPSALESREGYASAILDSPKLYLLTMFRHKVVDMELKEIKYLLKRSLTIRHLTEDNMLSDKVHI